MTAPEQPRPGGEPIDPNRPTDPNAPIDPNAPAPDDDADDTEGEPTP